MKDLRLIFLDIDGVLNNHADVWGFGIHTIDPAKVRLVNLIVHQTGAELVISSAWRYMILGGAMTLDGFRYMLNTYGLSPDVKLHGHTCSDEVIPERGEQIRAYVLAHAPWSYVVLDDGDDEQRGDKRSLSDSLATCNRWIKVDGSVGLDEACAHKAIRMLEA